MYRLSILVLFVSHPIGHSHSVSCHVNSHMCQFGSCFMNVMCVTMAPGCVASRLSQCRSVSCHGCHEDHVPVIPFLCLLIKYHFGSGCILLGPPCNGSCVIYVRS